MYVRRRAGTQWVHFMAECDAAPQFLANYELDVFIEVQMDDLHGTGPRPNQPLAENPFQNLDSVRSGHEIRTPQAWTSVAQ